MPHPNFSGFRSHPGRVCPDDPRRSPILRPDHTPAKVRFPSVPCLCFEHDSDRFAASLSIGASQPRNVVGEGLGWVERSHPKSPNITHRTTRRRFSECTLPMFHTPRRARRPKQHQPAPRRPTQRRKGRPGPLRTKLWRGHDFGGTFSRFGSRFLWPGRAVWIGVRPCGRPGPGRRGAQRVVGGLGCSLMLALAR